MIILTLAAAAALNAFALDTASIPAPSLDGLFDSGKVEPNLIPKFRPSLAAPPAPAAPDAIAQVLARVAVLPVSDLDRQEGVLDAALERLRREYGFVRDMSAEPRIPEDEMNKALTGQYPPTRPFVFEVRGFIPESGLAALAADKAVRGAMKDASAGAASADQRALLEFLAARADRLLAVPGVAAAGLGWDCLAKGEHVHILPHHPALVIKPARRADLAELRLSLLGAVPEFAQVRFALDTDGRAGASWGQ